MWATLPFSYFSCSVEGQLQMTVNVSIVEQLRKTVSLHGWYCNIMRDQFLHSHVHDLLVTLLNLKITISSRRVSHVIFFSALSLSIVTLLKSWWSPQETLCDGLTGFLFWSAVGGFRGSSLCVRKKKQTETCSIEVQSKWEILYGNGGRTCFFLFVCLFSVSLGVPVWFNSMHVLLFIFFLVRKIDVFAFAFLFSCLSTCGVKMCPPVLSCQNNLFSSWRQC